MDKRAGFGKGGSVLHKSFRSLVASRKEAAGEEDLFAGVSLEAARPPLLDRLLTAVSKVTFYALFQQSSHAGSYNRVLTMLGCAVSALQVLGACPPAFSARCALRFTPTIPVLQPWRCAP